MREYNESWRVWKPEYIPQWQAAGPDMEVDLEAGQSMLLPRGWVHNPAVADTGEWSVHLTFTIRERTPCWVAEKLIEGAIQDPEFRRVLLPRIVGGDDLVGEVTGVRLALVDYLQRIDPEATAGMLRTLSLSELEYTT